MFVGEAPGAEEEREERPFVGPSGRLLRDQLKRAGIKDVFITNTVRCRPPNNRQPTPTEISACREYLADEIKRVKPEYVVALGATAAKTLFVGKSKVTQFHGAFVEPNDKHPYRGYIAYHPAFTLRDPSKLPAFTQDLKRLARAVNGEERAPEAPWSLVRRGNLRKFLREFIAAPEFSFDLETSSYFMHAPGGYINAISIDLPDRTWVVPCMDYDPINKRRKYTPWRRGDALRELIRILVKIQRKTEKRCVGHNGKFDNLWLRRITGYWFKLTFDTMLASHALDENREHDLKTLARTILDVPEYDLTPKEKKGFVVPRKLYRYGAYDAYYTRKLKEIFYKELQDEPELHRLYHKLIIKVARAMENLEMVGKTVNLEKWDETTLNVHSEVLFLETELNEMAGKKINWNSPQQIGALLFDELELEVTQWTDGGAPSTSEEALFDLRDEHPLVNKLLDYRERTKFLGTYLHGLREYMVGNTLYIPYKIHGTVGGRYSSPIHSIPRDGTIRNLIEAPPGWDLFVADISQAELRFAAHLSGDLEMRRCFRNGIDIHWRTLMYALGQGYIGNEEYVEHVWSTVKALGKKADSIGEACEILLYAGHDRCTEIWKGWKEGRYRAKCLNFGFLYGMYEDKFIELAKTDYQWEPSWDEAHSMRAGFFELYSGLPKWHDKEKKIVRNNGYARILSGRRRRLPAIYSKEKWIRAEAERQAVNIRVQGFIGDYKSMALVEADERLNPQEARLVGEHHDALLGIVRKDSHDRVLPVVRQIMKRPKLLRAFNIELDIPMNSDIEIGKWGAGTKYKDPEQRRAA